MIADATEPQRHRVPRGTAKGSTRILTWTAAYSAIYISVQRFAEWAFRLSEILTVKDGFYSTESSTGRWFTVPDRVTLAYLIVTSLKFPDQRIWVKEYLSDPATEVSMDFLFQVNAELEKKLFPQRKKRKWGLFIALKRSRHTRSAKKNRLCIRIPHK